MIKEDLTKIGFKKTGNLYELELFANPSQDCYIQISPKDTDVRPFLITEEDDGENYERTSLVLREVKNTQEIQQLVSDIKKILSP